MKRAAILLAFASLLLLASVALADWGTSALPPLSTGYDLSWSTVDGGGATFSTGGGYSLGGTIGQPDAGAMSGGGYSLSGGFWGGIEYFLRIYLPLILKQYTP